MNRNIITTEDLAPAVGGPDSLGGLPSTTPAVPAVPAKADDYFDRLMKYIPVEIITAYLLIDGIIRSLLQPGALTWGLILVFLAGAVGTWFFAQQVLGITRRVQLTMSVIAFVVWVFAIGGWFSTLQFWVPGWGTIAVIIFGVLVKVVKLDPLP